MPAAVDAEGVRQFIDGADRLFDLSGADRPVVCEIDVGQAFLDRREGAVAIAHHPHIQAEVALREPGVRLCAARFGRETKPTEAEVMHRGRAQNLAVVKGGVLAHELALRPHAVERVNFPGGVHHQIPSEDAVVVADPVIDAA